MPLPSPTTTSAVKLNLRPPWTTLATRLMVTTRSRYAVPLSAPPPRRSSRRSRRSPPPLPGPEPRRAGAAIRLSFSRYSCSRSCRSQFQSALARAVGERREPAVVGVAAAVEDHGADPGGGSALGNKLADLMRLRLLVAAHLTDLGFQGRCGCERVTRHVIDELGEDVPCRARDDEPGPHRAAGELLAHPQMPPGARRCAGRRAAPAAHVRSGPGASHVLL